MPNAPLARFAARRLRSEPSTVQTMAQNLHERLGPELSGSEVYDILRLRVDVFVVEQNCPYHEVDGRDLEHDALHLWLADAEGISAYLRVLSAPEGRRIGRVVTRADARGRGLSAQLMGTAVARFGHEPLQLDAQAHLQDFYRRFGFEPASDEFLEDGIPHVTMKRVRAEA